MSEGGDPGFAVHPTVSSKLLAQPRQRHDVDDDHTCSAGTLRRRASCGWLRQCDPHGLNLTALNQLGWYTYSPGRRAYCYAQLAIFFPMYRQYSVERLIHVAMVGLSRPGWRKTHLFHHSSANIHRTVFLVVFFLLIMTLLIGGGIKRTSVAYIGRNSRTERPRKTKIGTYVAHVTRDSDTTFKVKRSKVKVTRPL